MFPPFQGFKTSSQNFKTVEPAIYTIRTIRADEDLHGQIHFSANWIIDLSDLFNCFPLGHPLKIGVRIGNRFGEYVQSRKGC